MEEYDIVEIPGKHGKIRLHFPKREPTQKEIDDLHRTVAEVIVNINKDAYNKEVNKNSKKTAIE